LYFDIQIKDIKPETPGIKKRRIKNEERKANESKLIAEYLEDQNIAVEAETEGYYFFPIYNGTGKSASDGQQVRVHYKGYFLDGKPYDSSYDRNRPVSFVLGKGEVISGWELAVKKMAVGDKAKVILPSELAFGASERNGVEPYTPMIFELELIEVK
jgi:FKBP-type peptidyl-prolyl cis-trans isomerase